jgi:hypothetical protein
MENPASSMFEITQVRAQLIRKGHGSLRAWALKRGINYNTAYAALRGFRGGPKALRAAKLLRRDTA